MHHSKEFLNDFMLKNFDYNKNQTCLTFSIEGQAFGLLLSNDVKVVAEQGSDINFNIDVRKILDMPTTKRPVEKLFVSKDNEVYKIEVDIKGYEFPCDAILSEQKQGNFNSLWNDVAEGVSYVDEQLIVLLSFEKMLRFKTSLETSMI